MHALSRLDYQYIYSALNLLQFLSITLVMVRRTRVTGASKMATSPSKILLIYTVGFVKALSSQLLVTAVTQVTG